MTLISFATYGDHAEFITDSVAYTRSISHLQRCTKSLLLPHLDAALLAQGDSQFGILAKSVALAVSPVAPTFDDLVATLPAELLCVWGEVGAGAPDSVVFLLGYSPAAERFTAYGFASDTDFKAFEITRPWVMPTPWSHQPSQLEAERLRRYLAHRPDVDEAVDQWLTQPPLTAPSSIEDWASVAAAVRFQRALPQIGKTIVAGDVFHTRISRGSSATRLVFCFDDSGEEFQEMVAGTSHPQALLGPCPCGETDKRFVDHCLAECLAEECPGCDSGLAAGLCCRTAAAAVLAQAQESRAPV